LYEKYFRHIVKHEFAALEDLGDVRRFLSDKYRMDLETRIKQAHQITAISELNVDSPTGHDDVVFFSIASEVRSFACILNQLIQNEEAWAIIADYFHLWDTVPIRGMYMGVQVFWWKNRYILLVASFSPMASLRHSRVPEFKPRQLAIHRSKAIVNIQY